MIALFDAQRTGRGRDVDTSLYDVALALLTYPATWYLTSGIVTERQPHSGHPSMVPFQFFETADGYIAIACPKEKFFQMLVQAIDLPELATDPRFASFTARREHRVTLVSILSQRFKQHTTASWMQRLRGRVPCAPVRSLNDALEEDELTERHMLASYSHPAFGRVRAIGTPFTLGGFQPEYRAGPRLNSDQRAILADLGYDAAAIADLAAAGAFGNHPVGRWHDPVPCE
jgi:crotonobetainyl-CoA:carnitine CoA-transferase CaiB-like acyl-CoA transferase